MKKILDLIKVLRFKLLNSADSRVISNEKIDNKKVEVASKIIAELQNDLQNSTKNGLGPFVAAIYDEKGNFIVKAVNSVVNDQCSNNHAEMNAIKAAEEILGTCDLAPYNLKLYISAEPCMMCLGGIMWSGIKEVYFGVPSKIVERITGFDEGFKHNWLKEFKKRGIIVYGNIEPKLGERELYKYMQDGKEIYNPSR